MSEKLLSQLAWEEDEEEEEERNKNKYAYLVIILLQLHYPTPLLSRAFIIQQFFDGLKSLFLSTPKSTIFIKK
jgi:hypothetical protein